MVYTSASFETDSKPLQKLYDSARDALLSSRRPFLGKTLLALSPTSDKATLNASAAAAPTLADYDLPTALDTLLAFAETARPDGRLPSAIAFSGGKILPSFDLLTCLAFTEEAIRLYKLSRHGCRSFLLSVYEAAVHFDEYLWTTHDVGATGCLQLLSEYETEEGGKTLRYTPLHVSSGGKTVNISLFPIFSVDLMCEAYRLKKAIADMALLLGKPGADETAAEAEAIRETLLLRLYMPGLGCFYDRDYRGELLDTLTLTNLRALYYGAVTPASAASIVRNHLMNEKEFYTRVPLTSISLRTNFFRNNDLPDYNGQPHGESFLRIVTALDRYGLCREQIEIGKRFLTAVTPSRAFTEQFNPFTGEPTGKSRESAYAPTAAAALEFLKRFYGITCFEDRLIFGVLGMEEDKEACYSYTIGGDSFELTTNRETGSATISGRHLFTVTAGVRVTTGLFGEKPIITNITGKGLDIIFVYGGRTYSFPLTPNEAIEIKPEIID